jgi:hypothetical protein
VNLLQNLSGKKTIIGSLLLCLLGAVGSFDVLIHGSPTWISPAGYVAIGAIIKGLTDCALRVGIRADVEKAMETK